MAFTCGLKAFFNVATQVDEMGLQGGLVDRRDAHFEGTNERYKVSVPVTVGTAIASCPPYRSVRAELPHTAPTLDEWRQNAHLGKDAGLEDVVSIVRRSGVCASS